jgi:hypothetical protein
MKLIISRAIVGDISRFAKKYGSRERVFEDFRIIVLFKGFSIIFLQPERYSQLVVCYFDFGSDIGFFFDDVVAAIEEETGAHQAVDDRHPDNIDVLTRNDRYIHHVLEYCEENINTVMSMPPSWFQRAMDISDATTRKNFPSLADEDLRKKRELWESWRN